MGSIESQLKFIQDKIKETKEWVGNFRDLLITSDVTVETLKEMKTLHSKGKSTLNIQIAEIQILESFLSSISNWRRECASVLKPNSNTTILDLYRVSNEGIRLNCKSLPESVLLQQTMENVLQISSELQDMFPTKGKTRKRGIKTIDEVGFVRHKNRMSWWAKKVIFLYIIANKSRG